MDGWTQEAADLWELSLADGRRTTLTRHGALLAGDEDVVYRVVKAPGLYVDFPTFDTARDYAEGLLRT